jgi:hypothetical protein
MVSVNEPGGRPAPRFFFGRTSAANVWRHRYDLPTGMVGELEDLAAGEPANEDLRAAPGSLTLFQKALGNDPAKDPTHFGPAYQFPDNLPVSANVTRMTDADLPLLLGIWNSMEEIEREFEVRQPFCAVIEDGVAVSQCFSARLTDRAAAAGVETLEKYRGRGYASAVVAAWAKMVIDSGRIPFYDTWWENVASQAVARKLGLIHYATLLEL